MTIRNSPQSIHSPRDLLRFNRRLDFTTADHPLQAFSLIGLFVSPIQNTFVDEPPIKQNGEPQNESSPSNSSLSVSCPSLTDQLLLNAREDRRRQASSTDAHSPVGGQISNGHHDALNGKPAASQRQPKSARNRVHLVKQQQRKCYSTNSQRKSKMGDLCGKSMSQSASAMSIKQQPASKPEKGETSQDEASDGIKVQPEEAFPRVSKKAISSSTNLPSDANNNTTAGSVKILVEPASNDITPSNSQEFLLQQQRQSSSPTSSRSSQQTSPIHRRALMQQSRSTSNITSLTGPSGASLTKEQLIKSQPTTTRTGGEKVAYLCHCPASGGTLNAKHRTRRRKSWSSYSSNELPTSAKTPSFSPYSNVQQSDQNASRSSQQEKFDQIKAQLEYW